MTTKEKLNYLKNLTVLYADDDAVLLEYMRVVLEGFFASVITATNGVEALEAYEQNTIHIIILDNQMPLASGLDVATKIRKQDKKIPIFFATNYKDSDDLMVAVKLNLVDYIIKPLSFDRLKEALFTCIERLDEQDLLKEHIKEDIFYSHISKSIIKNGQNIVLTKLESSFIEFLLEKKGAIATLEELEYFVWNGQMSKDTLRNYVSKIRKKLGVNIIENIHNIGYKLVC